MTTYGPIGRLGGWTATHFKAVVIAWGVLALGLGFFAPEGREGAVGRRLGVHRLGVGRRA